MESHRVYIAASHALLTWSSEQFGRFAVKVGTSRDPSVREVFLNGRNPYGGGALPPCCGCSDWQVVAVFEVASRDAAEDLEARFKAAFDPFDAYGRHAPPWLRSVKSAGESDLVLLPERAVQGEALRALDKDVRDLYFAARSELYRAVRAVEDPAAEDADEEAEEERRARREYEQGEEDIVRENLDCAERANDTGSYYA
ncbi:MAG TPA: hypothetical protein VEZ20_09290 [Allosphingosinicella sp.]|jgi:hypothetical protein|nr:hypothetical protein [Allosphingosinicella sp.]